MDAVRAMPMILKKFPRARHLLAGDETHGFKGAEKKRIADEVARLGLEKEVVFIGFHSDVQRLLGALDVFLLPSHCETYSLSVVEAKLCEVPIVAASTGGVPQNLGYGEYGELVAPKNPAAFASGVTRVLENRPLYKEKAAKGRKNALYMNDENRILDIIDSEYRRALAETPVASIRVGRALLTPLPSTQHK